MEPKPASTFINVDRERIQKIADFCRVRIKGKKFEGLQSIR